jgi:hypothetical protein
MDNKENTVDNFYKEKTDKGKKKDDKKEKKKSKDNI